MSIEVATWLTIVYLFLEYQNTGVGLKWPYLYYVTLSLQPKLIDATVGRQLTQTGPIILSLLTV